MNEINQKVNGKEREEVICGTFLGHPKGFGFVRLDGMEEDYYVPEDMTGNAFHLDRVQIEPLPGHGLKKHKQAKVIAILEHGITKLVGTFDLAKNGHYGFVIPDNAKIGTDVFIPAVQGMGLVAGHKIIVEITDYGCRNRERGYRCPEGKVLEILGHENDPGVDVLSIIKGYDLPMEFGEAVLNQAARVAKPVSEADMASRKDLRDLTMVTIDGEDSKDLDDAVSLSYDGTFYQLGVHIADVANYVQENSALDWEAKKRGCSVYLADRVIPMLPHALCNGICSLNEGEDRLALSCCMKVDGEGNIVDYEICESVIHVNKRMTYSVVADLIEKGDGSGGAHSEYAHLLESFRQMRDLAMILREKRREKGSIDFDLPECKIVLDQAGNPLEVKPYDRNVATRIIEEFMLAANETVAQHFYWQDLPFLYRVHPAPDQEKLRLLSEMIGNMGYSLKTVGKKGKKLGGEELHPKEIQKLLDRIQGTPEEAMISRMVLRGMNRARYSVDCTGHFGLAFRYYCHFTSPIRRYPDLQIHRIIKQQLRGKLNEDRIRRYREILPEVADCTSKAERRAEEAERETDKLKKVQYMQAHVGERYEGVISGVTPWGFYVELLNTVEGMVPLTELKGDYYLYVEKQNAIVGQVTGKVYRLGMPVRIKVLSCDLMRRTVDFGLEGKSDGEKRESEADSQQ